MKVTKTQLKDIIREEVENLISESDKLELGVHPVKLPKISYNTVGGGLKNTIKKWLVYFMRWEIQTAIPGRSHMHMKEKADAMRDLYKKLGIKTSEEKFQKYIDSQLEVIRKEVLNAVDIHVERISKDLGVQSIGSAAGKVATRVTRKSSKR